MFVFLLKHTEQNSIAVVTAVDPSKAFELLAKAKQPDEPEPNVALIKKHWEVQTFVPVNEQVAILEASLDMSEGGCNVFVADD
jgi:hypothetical protein